MDTSHRRSLNRGASILAGVVFIAILGVVGLAVRSTVPSSGAGAQVAASAESTAPSTASSKPPAVYDQSQAPKSCDDAISRALGLVADGGSVSVNNKSEAGTMDACYGAVLKDGKKPSKNAADYQCVGRRAWAYIVPGSITVSSLPLKGTEPSVCATMVCQGTQEQAEKDSKICTDSKLMSGLKTTQSDKTDKVSIADTSTEKPDVPSAPGGPNDGGALGSAYSPQEQAIQKQIDDTDKKIQSTQALIDACGRDISACGNVPELNATKADLAKLQADKAALQKQMDALTANQKQLTPTGGFNTAKSCGQPGSNPSTCIPTGTQTTTTPPPTQQPPSTFPGPGTGGSPDGGGGSNPLSSLGSLLSNLMKSLGGGGGGSGSGGSPQACSADSAVYQQQQQQYQQLLQQYQVALQQYNYQLQLNAAYGNGNSAPQPPTAPQPCTPYDPSSSIPPAAQISCQPSVGDPGMTLAISYSCSSGAATGSGFTTTGPSGSVTATIATPPAGTNTATYGLLCTNKGMTSSAQCTVQISRPSIIFVANPKTVTSGDTSLLGWITSGIQSCVVSSPQQADFTARNASSTNTNGTAVTSPLTTQSTFALHCMTVSGLTKDASTTIEVIAP